jgi:hypothetical protein
MGENAAVAAGRPGIAGTAAASFLSKLLLLGLNHSHLLLTDVPADWLLDHHHLVGLGFVGRL